MNKTKLNINLADYKPEDSMHMALMLTYGFMTSKSSIFIIALRPCIHTLAEQFNLKPNQQLKLIYDHLIKTHGYFTGDELLEFDFFANIVFS